MTTFLLFALTLSLLAIVILMYCRAAKIELSLRDDWRNFYTWFSTWLTGAGVVVTGWLIASPTALTSLWENLPPEIKAQVPQNYALYITLALFIAAQIAKGFKQEKK